MQLAISLYNNTVDDDDELEFRKDDILTVLIENPHGFEGWWLCKHKDKCGLCPGNRLKLIQNSNSPPVQITDHLNSRFSTISVGYSQYYSLFFSKSTFATYRCTMVFHRIVTMTMLISQVEILFSFYQTEKQIFT